MKNFQSLESLRAWMAWWVVLGHALQLAGAGNNGFLGFVPSKIMALFTDGGPPVAVFIIISGFVIGHLLLAKREPYLPYITRRAFRIFPIYLFALFVALATINLYQAAWIEFPFAIDREMRVARFAAQQDSFWAHLGLHLTMLHGLVPENILPFSSTTILGPAWSLSLEWQFYLIAPFMFAVFARSRNAAFWGTIGIVLIQIVVTRQHFFDWQYNGFLPKVISYFAIGILSRLTMERMSKGEFHLDFLLITAALILTIDTRAAIIWLVFFALAASEAGLTDLKIPALRFFGKIAAFNSVTSRLGMWSYSTYLMHVPIFSIVLGTYVRLFGVENVSQSTSLFLLLASFPFIAILSGLLYSTIEDPFRKMGGRLAKHLQRSDQAQTLKA
jgi:peptidoglycan/LPS O-acetylase OafA/YrhL